MTDAADTYNHALPEFPTLHPEYGAPIDTYTFYRADGCLHGRVYTFHHAGRHVEAALTMNGVGWRFAPLVAPVPLWNLLDLAARPDAPVCLADSPAAALAAMDLLPEHVCVAWTGGVAGLASTDLTAVAGRHVLIWCGHQPTAKPCAKAVKAAGGLVTVARPTEGDGWGALDAVEVEWGPIEAADWLASQGVSPPHISAPVIDAPDDPSELEPVSQIERRLSLGLDQSSKGQALTNLNNATLVLERDRNCRGLVWYDGFLQRVMTGNASFPPSDAAHVPTKGPREWTDADDINLTLYMQRALGLQKIGVEIVTKAVIGHAYRTVKNCVRDWLDGLIWDGTERIAHFFPDHFGAENSVYSRAVGRNFWLTIAARVYRPGCQVDNMVILEGMQGSGKSKALRIIGGAWFAEQHEAVTGKGFFETLQGKLLVEIGEMDAFNKSEVTKVKQVVSCPSDRYRESYGRHAKDHPRQCVFVGTTNRDDWNRDETGARRFWPIACRDAIDADALTSNRDQLFAEAVTLFKDGASWWEMPTEETTAQQKARYTDDIWHERIADYLALRTEVLIPDILEEKLGVRVPDQTKAEQMRVGACLRVLGWDRIAARRSGRVVKVWMRSVPL